METLRTKYLKANKKEKGIILDEYCNNTGQERKYAIKKFGGKIKLKEKRKKRKEYYNNLVKPTLVEIWKIFDRPCGQRLKTLIEDELERLRRLGEIKCSDETTSKLKKMSSATIDRKLEHEKEVLKLSFKYSKKKKDFTLLGQVPIKTSADLDRAVSGNIQIDCVEHCGMSASGEYANSLTTIDILSGWWEGEAFLGKGQERTLMAIDASRKRSPGAWKEMHPDNGMNLLNWHAYKYAKKEGLEYSRSRPYKKNDNCFVEQKNSTHVRKPFGYLRYDTQKEIDIINDLYRNELRLFKNFFQPVMKLKEKIRIKGRIYRKYDKAKTPYYRIMESDQFTQETKDRLKEIYDNLNPAELKRNIDIKVKKLYEVYLNKNGGKVDPTTKRLTPSMVSFSVMHSR